MNYQEYKANLAKVEAQNPDENLLKVLKTGYTAINVVYMRAALKRISESAYQGNVTVKAGKKPAPAVVVTMKAKPGKKPDETLRALWAERQHLFGDMNKASNHFHKCKTDAERKENSQRIMGIWEKILEVKEKIRHYEEFGSLPEPKQVEKFPLPDDPVALVKKLASIRALISQEQKKLRELFELNDDHPEKQSRINEAEDRRKHLMLYKGHAEQKIQGIQRSGV